MFTHSTFHSLAFRREAKLCLVIGPLTSFKTVDPTLRPLKEWGGPAPLLCELNIASLGFHNLASSLAG